MNIDTKIYVQRLWLKQQGVSSDSVSQEQRDKVTRIFIRTDGWSLGVEDGCEEDAYQVWSDQWYAYVHKLHSGWVLFPIHVYEKERRAKGVGS